MGLIDFSAISALSFALYMSAIGGGVAYLSAWAATTAKRLEEEEPLLPALVRSARSGGVMGPWFAYAVVGAVVGGVVSCISPQTTAIALLLALCIPACIMDLDLMVIPDELTWAILFSGALVSPWHYGAEDAAMAAAVTTSALWLSMAAVEYRTGKNMRAGGDIAAAAAGGAWMGMSLSGVYVVTVCLVCFVYHFALRHRNEDGWIPLGPALLVAIPLTPHIAGIIHSISLAALSIA